MKRHVIAMLRYSVMAAIFVFGAWYLHGNYDRFASKIDFHPRILALLIFLNLSTLATESFRLRIQISKLGHTLGVLTSWNMMSLIQAANHAVLKAGTFSGGYYLSRTRGISFHSYFALVVTYVVIMTLGSGVFGLLTFVFYLATGASVAKTLLMFFIGIIALCCSFIAVARFNITIPYAPRIVTRIIDAWREVYSDIGFVARLTAVETVYFFLCALRFYIALKLFSIDTTFIESVAVVTVGNFLRVASIVPGGLGVAEVGSGWTAGLMGGDAGVSGLAAGFDRLIYVGIVAVFGGIAFLMISGRESFHSPPDETLEKEKLTAT